MSIRFQADEDVKRGIIKALHSREPAIDLLDVKLSEFRGLGDPVLLEIAAQQERIVLSHDESTMPRHFKARQHAGKSHPGLLIIPQRSAIGPIIESLLLIWAASDAAEWRDRIEYLPLK